MRVGLLRFLKMDTYICVYASKESCSGLDFRVYPSRYNSSDEHELLMKCSDGGFYIAVFWGVL